MYSVMLDKNNYFTGSYAETGSVMGGIHVPTLPPDMTRATCYRLEGDDWIYDEDRWEQIQTETALVSIREQRDDAFALIDKYQLTLVYGSLTPEQQMELAEYRKAWLDAPETLAAPKKSDWMI